MADNFTCFKCKRKISKKGLHIVSFVPQKYICGSGKTYTICTRCREELENFFEQGREAESKDGEDRESCLRQSG